MTVVNGVALYKITGSDFSAFCRFLEHVFVDGVDKSGVTVTLQVNIHRHQRL